MRLVDKGLQHMITTCKFKQHPKLVVAALNEIRSFSPEYYIGPSSLVQLFH